MPRRSSAWWMIGALLLVGTHPLPAEAARYIIEIKNMSFGPPPSHLLVGDTIRWKNDDIFRHSATARRGDFDLDLAPGAQGEAMLKKAGVLTVFCRYHPAMTMRLMVEKGE